MARFQIQAHVSGTTNGWQWGHQVPTFFLDSDVSGVTNPAMVESVARDIVLTATRDKSTAASVTVTPVESPCVRVLTRVYAAWQEGDDERETVSEREDVIALDVDEFDAPVPLALAWLTKEGFGTDGTEWSPRAWLTATYEHPYEGTLEERHAFLEGFTIPAAEHIWSELA